VGPDLFGIAWAMGFLVAMIGIFALVDRLLTGACDALRDSPGSGLVTGMSAWHDGTVLPHPEPSSSPGGEPPTSPDPVLTEPVHGPGLLPWSGGRVLRFAN
jgi:hypothetical protein